MLFIRNFGLTDRKIFEIKETFENYSKIYFKQTFRVEMPLPLQFFTAILEF